jgi:DNA-directed RNA polymerase III subunit RPC6
MQGPADAEQMVRILEENPAGISQEEFARSSGWSSARIMSAGNLLLSESRIELIRSRTGGLLFKTASEAKRRMIGLDQNHHHVYGLIEESKNVGIWHRDLKEKSKLQQHVLAPILKALENKKLIKNVKSIQFKSRKVYMAYDMEPAKEVSGGTFHRDGALDQELISSLREHCMTFVNSQNEAVGLANVHSWVSQTGTSDKQLTESDVRDIMNTLVLDHKVTTETRGGKLVYRRARPRWRPHFLEVALDYADHDRVWFHARERDVTGQVTSGF